VLDWRATGGLDLLAQLPLAGPGEAPDPVLLRSILELRLSVGIDAARRCAERATAATLAALREALETQRLATPAQAPLVYAHLWDHVVDGADNIAYRLAYNSLLAGLDPDSPQSRALFAGEACDLDAVAALVAAIAAGDPDAAAEVAESLLTRAIALAASIDHTEETTHG
jgi:DNA-binding FadR family transcriptional regulator